MPTYINKAFHKNIDLPKTEVMSNAVTAVSAIPTGNLFWIALGVIIIVAVLIIYGSLSMFSAY